MRLRPVIILLSLIILVGFLAYQIEIAFPGTPSINNTYTPFTQPAPQEIGSYDVLGKAISKDEAATLLQSQQCPSTCATRSARAACSNRHYA